jgi:hypothetical protein
MSNEITITTLPNEMIDTIFSFMKPSLSNLIKYHIISQDLKKNMGKIKMVAILRIQLAFRIKRAARKLWTKIFYQLNKMFKMAPPATFTTRGDCVYYAPHIPGAHCRFCYGYAEDHKISERLILKYYLPVLRGSIPEHE